MQPSAYSYLGHLRNWIDLDKVFVENFYPRQLQIYLPGSCNFSCSYCAGRLSPKNYKSWEAKGIKLLKRLGDRVLLHMYSGCCNEPTLNAHLLEFMTLTKRNGCYFGLKTNGSKLIKLESNSGFMTKLCDMSNESDPDKQNHDFVSISLDAGYSMSHGYTKRIDKKVFMSVVDGIRLFVDIRSGRDYPAIRISYLLNKYNDSPDEIKQAISIAGRVGADSIRFSQPHPAYAEDKDIANATWAAIAAQNNSYKELFDKLESDDRPVVFYAEPKPVTQRFNRCAHGYYQITLAHDGNLYKCPIAPSVDVSELKLDEIPDNLDDFWKAICKNQSELFDPSICYKNGIYCCRAAEAVNEYYHNV